MLFANSTNITCDYMEAAYWSTIELYAGIVTASLPGAYNLFISTMISLGISPKWLSVKNKMSSGSSGKTPAGSGAASSRVSKSDNRAKSRQISFKRGDDPEFIRLNDVESGKSWD